MDPATKTYGFEFDVTSFRARGCNDMFKLCDFSLVLWLDGRPFEQAKLPRNRKRARYTIQRELTLTDITAGKLEVEVFDRDLLSRELLGRCVLQVSYEEAQAEANGTGGLLPEVSCGKVILRPVLFDRP